MRIRKGIIRNILRKDITFVFYYWRDSFDGVDGIHDYNQMGFTVKIPDIQKEKVNIKRRMIEIWKLKYRSIDGGPTLGCGEDP